MQNCFSCWGHKEGGAEPSPAWVTGRLPPSLATFCPFSPQIEEQLRKAEGKVGRKALGEADYMEVLERSCSQGWER